MTMHRKKVIMVCSVCKAVEEMEIVSSVGGRRITVHSGVCRKCKLPLDMKPARRARGSKKQKGGTTHD